MKSDSHLKADDMSELACDPSINAAAVGVMATDGVVGLLSSDDLLEALSQEFESLVGALRKGIQREKTERSVVSVPARFRPVFPAFGTTALE